MFEGFETTDIDVAGVRIHVRVGGAGDPVLLLHGYPETGAMWHRVAPALAEGHTVVVPDLRGYGDSDRPSSDSTHRAYSKRAMAADQAGLMRQLGHAEYAVVGHDRGARVAHRLALDHPDAVDAGGAARHRADPARVRRRRQGAGAHLRPLVLPRAGERPARGPDRRRRRALAPHQARPVVGRGRAVRRGGGRRSTSAVSTRPRSTRAPRTTAPGRPSTSCDDDASWRPATGSTCPTLVLWGAAGLVGLRYDALGVWREYAAAPELVQGHAVPGAHFLPEEAPAETISALRAFLG